MAIQKTTERTGNLTDNKIVDKITKVLKSSAPNSLEAVESKIGNVGFDREIPKERFISPEDRQKLLMI